MARDDVPRRKRGRNPFYEEMRLPVAERSTLEVYKTVLPDRRRMDRGHVVPSGDMTTDEGFAQRFSLANMVPQVRSMNQGAWNTSVAARVLASEVQRCALSTTYAQRFENLKLRVISSRKP